MSFGTENCFNAANSAYNSVAMLDATHFVVAYRDTGGDNYGCARIGTISEGVITYGAENIFNAADTYYISVAALDSTHFVVSYSDLGNLYYGTSRIGLVSGNTISSYGAEAVFNSANTDYISVATLDSTHFVVAYKDDGGDNHGCARVGLVSGTTISSYGTENGFRTVSANHISVDALDSTHFVVAYQYATDGRARVGLVSGTTISSYGSESEFSGANTAPISVAALDSTHFVIAYDRGAVGYARVGLVSGTTISSYGSELQFNPVLTEYISVSVLDSTHFVIAYQDAGGDTAGHTRVGLVSGTTISSYGTEETFNDVNTFYIGCAAINSSDYVVTYRDDGGAEYGCARVWYEPPSGNPFWYFNMLKRRNS